MQSAHALCLTLTIFLFSLALRLNVIINQKVAKRFGYVKNVAYYHVTCFLEMPYGEYIIAKVVGNIIGVWIPLIIVVIVHIVMFLKLRKQAQIAARSNSNETLDQLQRISKTFLLTVLSFFICLLPLSILDTIELVQSDVQNYYFWKCRNFYIHLANMSISLNPIVYSKIHVRIYKMIQCFIGWVLKKVRGMRSQPEASSNGGQAVPIILTSKPNSIMHDHSSCNRDAN